MKKSVVKNYMYNLVYQILILILPLVTTPYLSRVLGSDGVGIYSYTYAIVTYFVLFGSLGISLYGQREIAYAQDRPRKRKKIFFELIIIRFITVLIAAIVFFLWFVKGEQYQTYYMILLIELFATAFDISWFFQGIEEFKKTVLRNVLVRIVSVSLVFVFVKTSEDLWKYILIYSLGDFLGNLLLWFYLPRYLKGGKVPKLTFRRHIIPILLLFIPQVTNKLYNLLDTTMLGALIADKSETGFYEQSQKVIRVLLTIVTSLGIVMVPRMANTYAHGNKKQINSYLKNSFNFVFIISFPMMYGIASVATSFVPLFFGSGYEKAAILIMIFSPMLVLQGIENVIGTQYLLPTKRQKEYTISVAIGVLTNLILNYIFILLWQSIGASIATVISQIVVDGIQIFYVRKNINWRPIIQLFVKYLFASTVMFIACSITKLFIKAGLASLCLQCIVGVIVYVGLLFLLKDKFLYRIINTIKAKFLRLKTGVA